MNVPPATSDNDPPNPRPEQLESEAAEMSPAELEEARRYGRLSLACTLADMAIDIFYLTVMAFAGGRLVDHWLAGVTGLRAPQSYLRLLVLFLVVIALHFAVSFPLSFYSGYRLEHRFGLSNQNLARWLSNWGKTALLTVVLGAVLHLVLFWIIWNAGGIWWLIAAAAFFLFSIAMGQLYPVLIMPWFYKIEPLERTDLAERIGRLAEEGGLRVEGVYRLGLSADTKKANAMLAGMGKTRRVLMGDTLLEDFSPDEIAVIFAHEVGHHVHRHLPKMLAQGALLSLAGFWLCDRLLVGWTGAATAADVPTSALPLVMFALTLFTLVMAPIQNAISRHFERQSDRYALTATGLTDAYRSAFRKLARLNKDDPDPHPLEVFFLHSHPPIRERLAMAR